MPDPANNRRTLDDYERSARDYLDQVDSTPSPLGAEALRRLAAAAAPGKRVIEIGSGPGWDADYLETLGIAVHRTDATAAFRDIQAERGKHCDPLDVLSDAIPGTWDGIAMLYVLQHFARDELSAVLHKLARALREGGALLLSYVEGDEDHLERTVAGEYRVVHWTRADFDARLRQAGLVVDWDHAFQGKDWPWRIVLARVAGPVPASVRATFNTGGRAMLTGGCRCGAVRYQADVTDVTRHAVCHCRDCRRSSGAPAMAWLAVPKDRFTVTQGTATRWDGTGGAERYFCGQCGTGLYYFNDDVLPGICDIQSSTLDDAEAHAPALQIQCAERLGWMGTLHEVPGVERFPAG